MLFSNYRFDYRLSCFSIVWLPVGDSIDYNEVGDSIYENDAYYSTKRLQQKIEEQYRKIHRSINRLRIDYDMQNWTSERTKS